MKWFEETCDCSGQSIGEALLDTQAVLHMETGKVMRIARMGAESARAAMLGQGRIILLRGKGDTIGASWPAGAFVAIPSTLCPIALIVDRSLAPCAGVLIGDGESQAMRLCL